MRKLLGFLGYAVLALVAFGVVVALVNFPGLSKPVTERLRLDLRLTEADGTVWSFENIPVSMTHFFSYSDDGPCGEPEQWIAQVYARARPAVDGRRREIWLDLTEGGLPPQAAAVAMPARGGGAPSLPEWRIIDQPDWNDEVIVGGVSRFGPFWRFDVQGENTVARTSDSERTAVVEFRLKGRTPATFASGGVMVFDRFCGWR